MIYLIVILVIVGLGLFLFERLVPMDRDVKLVIHAVVIICLLLYILRFFLGGTHWCPGC